MRVLVTGGAGFIGSHLTEALLAEGATVRVLDNLSTGNRRNLAGLGVELIEGDVADWETVRSAVSGCTLVCHQAALVSVPRSLEQPELNHRSNVTGTFNVFEAARQAGARRVVYASSAAVYGDLPQLPKRETAPLNPITPYGAAKRTSEVLAGTYAAAYGLELVGLRYMNVFGPRQDPSSPYSGFLSIVCRAALENRGITIYGDGEQTRDFVYVADVVQANLRAARIPANRLPDEPVFNVGRGEQTSLNRILAMLQEIVERPLPVTYSAERPGDIKRSVADISRARQILGFEPETTLKEGLQATLAWFEADN